MDPQRSGGSPSSSSSSSERKARKRPWNSDEDPPSLGSSETSSHPPTQPDSPRPGASADGATTSKVASLLEESDNTLYGDDCADSESSAEDSSFAGDCTESEISDEGSSFADSESSAEDSVTPRQSIGKDERAGLISLSITKSINGRFIGETLNYRLPCTATEGVTCQIVRHLSAWNEFLCLVSWQLQEMPGTSGKLSLAFFREPSLHYCSPQQRHLVTLLACQLLKTHHCVAHVQFNISLVLNHHLLSDAFRGSLSITSVKLTFCSWISGDDLATAVLSLPHLQELECTGYAQHSATLPTMFSSYLRTATFLAARSVSDECPTGLNTEDFFRALVRNCSLKKLVLPGSLIAEAPPSARAAFTEWLTNSVSLKSLTVSSGPLKGTLGVLLENRSIVAVDFRCSKLYQTDVQLVSKIFEQNKVLRSFKLSYEPHYRSTMSSFLQGRAEKAGWDRCLKALVENDSLEEVALPIDVWDKDQWKELFEALPAKRNLKGVSIEAIRRVPAPFLGKLCAALTEMGADEKVSFNGDFGAEELDERFACKALSAVVVHVGDRNSATVHEILEHMPSLGHITSLHLDFDMLCELGRVLSSAVTNFLRVTRTLKVLSVSAPWDMLYDFQEALMAGLAANTTLREVRINVDETRDDFSVFSEPLADAINTSKTISSVHLEVEGRGCGEHAFFQRLSAGIADNFTLLSATVQGYSYNKFKRYWFQVLDTTRRNCGLLTSAADFARGARWDRHCALALERMRGHPELVEEVARLEKVDQARAAGLVRDGLRSIEGMHAFMRMAGVVKESVSCHACSDGRKQLDSLNEDCWGALRRYLKLYDIRDSTAEGLPR